jgi:MFS family permease
MFLFTFSMAMPLASFGVFLPVLAQAMGWSRGAISAALTINLVAGGLAAFGIGALVDRYGPRWVLTLAVGGAGAAYACAATTRSLWEFYLWLGLLVGVGTSSNYVLASTTISRWFDRGRGLALGIVLTGLNLGFMAGGPAAAWLIEAFGWRAAYVALGAMLWGITMPVTLCVRLPAPGAGAGDSTRGTSSAAAAAPDPSGGALSDALRDRRLWYLTVSWVLSGLIYMVLAVHIVAHARDAGADLEGSAWLLTSLGLSSAAGRLAGGALADRQGTAAVVWGGFALQGLALLGILAALPAAALYLLLALFGLGWGAADTVVAKVTADVFGLRAIASIMSILNFGWRLGAGVGPAAAGFAHDATGSYTIAFACSLLLLLVSTVLLARAAPPRRAMMAGAR